MQWSGGVTLGSCAAEGDRKSAGAIDTHELARGLSKDELCLQYQPKVSLNSGRIVGAEALVRWHSPDLGLLLPGHFIRTAERSGQIVHLGRRILKGACAQLHYWQKMGVPVPGVAVNTSPIELEMRDYADRVQYALAHAKLRPDMLTLEITESMAIDRPQQMVHLRKLAALGVRISLDDFGTGHASLRHLRQLPVHELKIDRGFVAGLAHGFQDIAIVGALITLAKSCGIVTVAEGVETVEQQAILAELGCDQIQGNLISQALSPIELERLTRALARRADELDAVLAT